MIEAFLTPRNRIRTVALLVICALAAIAAALVSAVGAVVTGKARCQEQSS